MAGKTFKLSIIVDATTKSATKGLGALGKTLGGVATAAGIVGTAVVGGAALAGGALLKLAIDAAPLEGIKSSFEGIAEASGKSGDVMLAALQKGSAGMITQRDLMMKYNLAASLVSDTFANELPNAMGYLTKVAAGTGEDMGFMLDSLVRGVGRLSPMILDNLGIQVDLNEAYEAFAPSVNKAASELNKQEQQAALMAQVMEKLAENTAAMPEVTGTAAAGVAGLKTKFADLKDMAGLHLLPALSNILDIFLDVADRVFPLVETAMEKVGRGLRGLTNILQGDFGSAYDNLVDVLGPEVAETFVLWAESAMDFGRKAKEWLAENIPRAIEVLKTIWTDYWPKAKKVLIDFWEAIQPALEWLKKTFQSFSENYLPRLKEAWDILKTGWDEIVSVYNSELKPALQDLWNALQPLWETLGIGEGASLDVGAAVGKFTGFLVKLQASGVIEAIKVAIHLLTINFRILLAVFETGKRVGQAVADVFIRLKNTIDRLKAAIEKVSITFDAFVSGAPGDFPWEDIFPPWLADFLYKLSNAFEGIRDRAIRVRDTFHSMFGIFNEIRHWISVLVEKFNHFKSCLGNFELPWWLKPGSSTPLELGLTGIAEALAGVQGLAKVGLDFGGGMALAGAGGGAGGGGITTVNIINRFGPDSVRSDQDILDIADTITQNLELRGIGPVL